MIQLTTFQEEFANLPLNQKIYAEGKFGCGKTTAAIARLNRILENVALGSEILTFIPNRTLAKPYQEAFSSRGVKPQIQTYNGFIQRSLQIFWPIISEKAGFAFPEKPPCFLTIETAQILMARLIESKLEQGYFSALRVPSSRIYNQIMISMHKAAAAEFPFQDYAERMKKSWTGEKSLLQIFNQTQECGEIFKKICYQNNLLDYSIQVEVFQQHLLPLKRYQKWLESSYHHFIYDNVEEDIPAAHHFARVLLKNCQSALIIADHLGGFRSFLGGDPSSAAELKTLCDRQIVFEKTLICSDSIQSMAMCVENPFIAQKDLPGDPKTAYTFHPYHQYPAMIKQAAADVADLIHRQNVLPSDIVIIAPLVSDVLYTSMERELRIQNIPCFIYRPSRPLIGENDSKSILTVIALIHPEWGIHPRLLDIVQMLQTIIPNLDPIRGHVLVARAFKEIFNDVQEAVDYEIKAFSEIPSDSRKRIPTSIGLLFDTFRQWILSNKGIEETPDISLSRFFHTVLTKNGFAAGNEGAEELNLGIKKVIESLKKFRVILEHVDQDLLSWKDYFRLVNEGMIAAQYYEDWFLQPENSVLISLASAYAVMNRPVSYQIWLNAGSPRWWERIYGQLTNDIVLSRSWQDGDQWDIQKEYEANNDSMIRQILALLSRCRKQVRVYASELSESGQDQKSRLLYLFADLSYRFGKNKDFMEGIANKLTQEISSDAFYPGIDDKDMNIVEKNEEEILGDESNQFLLEEDGR